MNLRAQVLEALSGVYDPELDEPITTLGFVGSCVASDAATSMCACGCRRRSAHRTSPS